METTATVAEKAKDLKQDVAELGSAVGQMAKEATCQLKTGATDIYAKSCEHAKTICQRTENYIKEEPYKAVLFAAALGLVAGLLITRK